MLQRLPIALAQVKAGNNSESLLNEIRQIFYSLYQSNQCTKKVHNTIINYLEVLKIKLLKTKTVKMCRILKLQKQY